jgi:hypothetical protein
MADSAHTTNLSRRALLACAVLLSIANVVVIVGIFNNISTPNRAALPAYFEPIKGGGWPKAPLWI